MLTFKIELPIQKGREPKRIDEKSYYNHNYYQLYEYGDWVSFGRCDNNILYEEYDECGNCYTYMFGRFENDKFVPVLGYTTTESVL